MTARHLRLTLPQADRELDRWRERAVAIPEMALRTQAVASIDHKRFHCQGGAVFGAWEPSKASGILRFIIPFQTISDYLDNLGDRTDSLSEADFRALHQAMLDAVSASVAPERDYYRHHPVGNDGGYLRALVCAAHEALTGLPRHRDVEPHLRRLVGLYVDLQVYKHLRTSERVPKLEVWFARHGQDWPELYWWEFAAAAGSTLAVFALVSEAARTDPIESVERMLAAYFPWICGLHILLDYLIDLEEDEREQDLNFVSYYRDDDHRALRLQWMLSRALAGARGLVDRSFHQSVVDGLLGLYLSDPKVRHQGMEPLRDGLLRRAGWGARLVHLTCRAWRLSSGSRCAL